MWLTLRNINTVFQWLKRKPGNFVLRHYYIFRMSHCDSHKYLQKPIFYKTLHFTIWDSNHSKATWHHGCSVCSPGPWGETFIAQADLECVQLCSSRCPAIVSQVCQLRPPEFGRFFRSHEILTPKIFKIPERDKPSALSQQASGYMLVSPEQLPEWEETQTKHMYMWATLNELSRFCNN